MPKTHQMPVKNQRPQEATLFSQQEGVGLINLRGQADDPAFVAGVQSALGLALPLAACSTVHQGPLRLVWAGPDDWFVIGAPQETADLSARLAQALSGLHIALTDVSSGYFLVTLAGPSAHEVLMQGCPMDLHPKQFPVGRAVGTHFFKVGLYLWRSAAPATYQMLVRRSFIDHFWQLIEHCSADLGWVSPAAPNR